MQDTPTPMDAAHKHASDIVYMRPPHLDALVLASAASHLLDQWDTVPRLLFTSPQGQTGKSTAMDVLRQLGHNGWDADATEYALRSRFFEPEPPFLIIDEVSDIFGQAGLGGARNNVAKIARKGYRQSFTFSSSVNRVSQDVPGFCFMAMGGLKTAVPNDIRTRCIVFPMEPRPLSYALPLASTDPDTEALSEEIRISLHQFLRAKIPQIKELKRSFQPPHKAFVDRRAQIWNSLYLTALAVGGDWPQRAITAFKALALDAADVPALTPHQQCLRDTAAAFLDSRRDRLTTRDIRAYLLDLPESPLWAKLTDGTLARTMSEALGPNTTLTTGDGTGKRHRGYYARPVLTAWRRLERTLQLADAPELPHDEFSDFFSDPDDAPPAPTTAPPSPPALSSEDATLAALATPGARTEGAA